MTKYLFIILIVTSLVFSKTLYVDQSIGNDATTYANNTEQNPWDTIGRAVWGNATRPSNADNGTPPTSSEAITAGDTLIVKAGTYNTNQGSQYPDRWTVVYTTMNEGTVINPIVIMAEGYVELQTDLAEPQPVIGCTSRDYVEWNGFTIYSEEVGAWLEDRPAVLSGCTGCRMVGGTWIGMYDASGPGSNTPFIYISGTVDCYIGGNDFGYSTGNSGNNNTALTIYDTNGLIIEYNTFHDNATGIYPKAPYTSSADNTQSQIIIRYNIFKDQSKGIHVLTDRWANPALRSQENLGKKRFGKIYQNVFINCDSGLEITPVSQDWRDSDSLIVANNTFYGCTNNIELSDAYYNDQYCYNNIIYGGTYGYFFEGTLSNMGEFDTNYNCFYNVTNFGGYVPTNYTITTWRSTFSDDVNSITSNPLFVNASADSFQLQATSPCSTGVDILDLDTDGQTNDAINMGAYITGDEILGAAGLGYEEEEQGALGLGLAKGAGSTVIKGSGEGNIE